MKTVAWIVLAVGLLGALMLTYRKIQREELSEIKPPPSANGASPLAARIRSLPVAPSSWKLIESAPPEMDLPEMPNTEPTIADLIDRAGTRVVFECYFMKQSFGSPVTKLFERLKNDVYVMGVLHPNPMSDVTLLASLRGAGAQIVERDLAPLGGNPQEGYLHSKFVVVDGTAGYIGSANFGAAAMTENREMGLYFEDVALANHLELMAQIDAGRLSVARAKALPSAVMLQGAADGFLIEQMPRCDEGIAALCDMARKEIDVMVFAFSHQFGRYDAIASPLRAAVRRGVKVRILHDARTVKDLPGVGPTLRDLKEWGMEIRLADLSRLGRSAAGQYHCKAMRVDGEFLMIGSNNWTDAASNENREVAVIIRSPRLVDQFISRFKADWNVPKHVKPYY